MRCGAPDRGIGNKYSTISFQHIMIGWAHVLESVTTADCSGWVLELQFRVLWLLFETVIFRSLSRRTYRARRLHRSSNKTSGHSTSGCQRQRQSGQIKNTLRDYKGLRCRFPPACGRAKTLKNTAVRCDIIVCWEEQQLLYGNLDNGAIHAV